MGARGRHAWPPARLPPPALAAGLTPRLVDFSGPAAGPFAASHVAGDGRLLVVPLPGHTPGHAGLLVDGETLLAGDASWPVTSYAC